MKFINLPPEEQDKVIKIYDSLNQMQIDNFDYMIDNYFKLQNRVNCLEKDKAETAEKRNQAFKEKTDEADRLIKDLNNTIEQYNICIELGIRTLNQIIEELRKRHKRNKVTTKVLKHQLEKLRAAKF
jgi:hypothetical protein